MLTRNHGLGITVSESATPIPLHFAFGESAYVEASAANAIDIPLRDLFDAPDLTTTDDEIANGSYEPGPGEPSPLAPRVHGTDGEHRGRRRFRPPVVQSNRFRCSGGGRRQR